ncbi:hypothetical protein Tco_0785394 [Tanacetum coccineum]
MKCLNSSAPFVGGIGPSHGSTSGSTRGDKADQQIKHVGSKTISKNVEPLNLKRTPTTKRTAKVVVAGATLLNSSTTTIWYGTWKLPEHCTLLQDDRILQGPKIYELKFSQLMVYHDIMGFDIVRMIL